MIGVTAGLQVLAEAQDGSVFIEKIDQGGNADKHGVVQARLWPSARGRPRRATPEAQQMQGAPNGTHLMPIVWQNSLRWVVRA